MITNPCAYIRRPGCDQPARALALGTDRPAGGPPAHASQHERNNHYGRPLQSVSYRASDWYPTRTIGAVMARVALGPAERAGGHGDSDRRTQARAGTSSAEI